ncbi:MAG: threonine/serine exporter family protein [Enterocloster asparagiformis]|nr:threonine/serine exporter family protein [Enterocloster asparagiformis]
MVMVIQTIGAFCAVASFTRILELPRRFLAWYGTAGALCWLVYLIVRDQAGSKILAAFVAGLAVAVFSHLAARILKAPVTVFLIPGILPLVPGASIYNSVYYMIQDSQNQSSYYLAETLQIAGSIAMAVFLVDSLFHLLRNGRKGRGERGCAGAAAEELCEQMGKFEKKT